MTDMNETTNKTDSAHPGQTFQLQEKIREMWPKMNDEDLKLYSGSREMFFARLKERYGVRKEDAERRIAEAEKAGAATHIQDKDVRGAA